MAEMLTYAPDLRSITGGQGDYTLEFLRYEEVPGTPRPEGRRAEAAERARRRARLTRCACTLSVGPAGAPLRCGAMATRSIVTSQPDVACDVCERRLLRGEQPDVFLAAGQPRMVCELCAPRAAHRGLAARAGRARRWPRAAAHAARSRPVRAPSPGARPEAARERRARAVVDRAPPRSRSSRIAARRRAGDGRHRRAAARAGGEQARTSAGRAAGPLERRSTPSTPASTPAASAGLARSLGAARGRTCARPRPRRGRSHRVAWELCWYRYEVDLDDSRARRSRAGQGTELAELRPRSALANALADERERSCSAEPSCAGGWRERRLHTPCSCRARCSPLLIVHGVTSLSR